MIGTNMESLPDSDGYDPESLGNAMLRAGAPEQQHPEYGLEMVPLHYGKPLHDGVEYNTYVEMDDEAGVVWEDTGRRLVRRNGEFVSDVSSRFKLVPNERVVAAANQAAKNLGAVPFHQFGDSEDDWYIQLDDHVFQDKARHRVHALYAWEDPVDLGGGDTIQFGFAVHNSIDGSLSFEVGLFSFRHACANMVTMGVGGQGQDFDDREVYAHTKRSHTKSLDVDVDELSALIENVMVFADDVAEGYSEWREQTLDPLQIKGLIDRLPAKNLPDWIDNTDATKDERDGDSVAEQIEHLREQKALDANEEADDVSEVDVTDVNLTEDEVTSIVADTQPSDRTAWEDYNDITESVWHDNTTSDKTKRRKFKQTHRVMPPADGIR